MAGYIGKSQGVTQVDGYNRTEADDRYVNASGDTMTGALGIQGATNSDVFKAGTAGTHLTVQTNDAVGEVKLKAQDDSGNNYWKYMTFHTEGGSGALERMRIDPQGRVTMPYQPAFYAYQSAVWTVASATWTQNTNLNSTRFNTGNHFNTSNGTFTAPVSGDYLFTHTVAFTSNTTNYFYVGIQVNGSFYTYVDGFNDAISGVDNTRGGSVIIRLNANDAVTFWLYDGNGGTIGAGGERTHVSGRLLG